MHKGKAPAVRVTTFMFAAVWLAAPVHAQAPPQPGSTASSPEPVAGVGEPPPSAVDALDASKPSLRFEFTAWAWLMGLDGTVGVRGQETDVSATFFDIADDSDSIVALSGRIELGYGRLGAFVDAFYADLGIDDVSGPLDLARIDVTYKQTVVDFGIMYRVAEWSLDGTAPNDPRRATLDAYAGGRYSKLDLEFDPAMVPGVSGDTDWIDPIVGAKLVLPFEDRWRFIISGDIGGFGVSSDVTWSATAVFGFDFELFGAPSSVLLGYRAIGWDYSDGSGEDRLVWDVTQHGPLLGLTIRF